MRPFPFKVSVTTLAATFRPVLVPVLPILAATLAAVMAVPVHAQTSAPHGGRSAEERLLRYVYYPVQQIYYSTEQQIWFWMQDGGWSYGVHLPADQRARIGTGVPVKLATTRPYLQHAVVEQRYGRPWRARHVPLEQQEAQRHQADERG